MNTSLITDKANRAYICTFWHQTDFMQSRGLLLFVWQQPNALQKLLSLFLLPGHDAQKCLGIMDFNATSGECAKIFFESELLLLIYILVWKWDMGTEFFDKTLKWYNQYNLTCYRSLHDGRAGVQKYLIHETLISIRGANGPKLWTQKRRKLQARNKMLKKWTLSRNVI